MPHDLSSVPPWRSGYAEPSPRPWSQRAAADPLIGVMTSRTFLADARDAMPHVFQASPLHRDAILPAVPALGGPLMYGGSLSASVAYQVSPAEKALLSFHLAMRRDKAYDALVMQIKSRAPPEDPHGLLLPVRSGPDRPSTPDARPALSLDQAGTRTAAYVRNFQPSPSPTAGGRRAQVAAHGAADGTMDLPGALARDDGGAGSAASSVGARRQAGPRVPSSAGGSPKGGSQAGRAPGEASPRHSWASASVAGAQLLQMEAAAGRRAAAGDDGAGRAEREQREAGEVEARSSRGSTRQVAEVGSTAALAPPATAKGQTSGAPSPGSSRSSGGGRAAGRPPGPDPAEAATIRRPLAAQPSKHTLSRQASEHTACSQAREYTAQPKTRSFEPRPSSLAAADATSREASRASLGRAGGVPDAAPRGEASRASLAGRSGADVASREASRASVGPAGAAPEPAARAFASPSVGAAPYRLAAHLSDGLAGRQASGHLSSGGGSLADGVDSFRESSVASAAGVGQHVASAAASEQEGSGHFGSPNAGWLGRAGSSRLGGAAETSGVDKGVGSYVQGGVGSAAGGGADVWERSSSTVSQGAPQRVGAGGPYGGQEQDDGYGSEEYGSDVSSTAASPLPGLD